MLRLKGGDPFMFGRGGEECQALARAGVAFRIVPGITAGIGGLAYAGIPATHRDSNHSVVFLTGHDASGRMPANVDWQALATASPVIVMYMAVKSAPEIARALIAGGRDPAEPLTFISNATLPSQSVAVTTLGQVGDFLPPTRRRPPPLSSSGTATGATSSTGTRAACGRTRLADGLVIAAPSSGSGKTVITLGLSPRFAGAASRSPAPRPVPTISIHGSTNAQPTSPASSRSLGDAPDAGESPGCAMRRRPRPCRRRHGAVRRPDAGGGSTADLAARLRLPVVLVVDAARQGQSIAALVEGFARHRGDVMVSGVIVNRLASDRHRALVASALRPSGILFSAQS